VVRLAGLIADDIAPIRVGLTEREFIDGLWLYAAASSARSASGIVRTRPASTVLGSSRSKARPPTSTRVPPIRKSAVLQIDVCPTLAALSPRRRPAGARCSACRLRSAAIPRRRPGRRTDPLAAGHPGCAGDHSHPSSPHHPQPTQSSTSRAFHERSRLGGEVEFEVGPLSVVSATDRT
jgi:hypothetical protein